MMHGFKEQLEAASEGMEVLVSDNPAEIEPHLDRIEIGIGDIPFMLIPRMPNFKWWQLWSAGADILQRLPALRELPFQLTTTSGIHGRQIAEHLFAMLLVWNRCITRTIEAQHRHEWLFIEDSQIDILEGKTMLIAGYGAIGKTIAQIAVSFGIKVTGLRRNQKTTETSDNTTIVPASELDAHLPQADYVVNILPLTDDTRYFFNAAQFSLMKKSALYVNLGRGATTNEAALINALREKRIKGALLDVVETEPLPKDSPLWDMDNVIITGHYAGCHPEYSRLAMSVALENLKRYRQGLALCNLVDKVRGY